MTIPFFAFSLAARSQLQLGSAEGTHIRLFLIQEKDAEGVGVERVQPVSADSDCTQNSVTYLMWKGDAEDVAYCLCVDAETGRALPAKQGRCPAR